MLAKVEAHSNLLVEIATSNITATDPTGGGGNKWENQDDIFILVEHRGLPGGPPSAQGDGPPGWRATWHNACRFQMLYMLRVARQYRYYKDHYYYGYISTGTTLPLLLQYRYSCSTGTRIIAHCEMLVPKARKCMTES